MIYLALTGLILISCVLLFKGRARKIMLPIWLLGAFALYALLGSPKLIPIIADWRRVEAGREQKIALIETKDPKILRDWIELGLLTSAAGNYSRSVEAFRQAVILSNGEPDLIMAYAKSLILQAGGKVTQTAHKSLDMVLLQQPTHPEARYFQALYYLEQGNAPRAMAIFKKLYPELPADSPLKARIDQQIGRKN